MAKEKIKFHADCFLSLPQHIKERFEHLVNFRHELELPKVNSDENHSTVALLVINNRLFWGINKKTAGISAKMIADVREVLKDNKDISAHSVVLAHAEADAILDAFNHHMNAAQAELYVDRKLCGFCAGKDFKAGSLRRLLPLLSLKSCMYLHLMKMVISLK